MSSINTDFTIQNGNQISDTFIAFGINTFSDACTYIKQIPYGRNTDKTNTLCVLQENKGTCSTKHALLKTLADENGMLDVRLVLGIFKMNGQNTPAVLKTLANYQLDYIPEAHNYLKHNDTIIDCTTTKELDFLTYLLNETEISREQITDYKVAYHKNYLNTWLQTEKVPYTLDEIWNIREACIAALSK